MSTSPTDEELAAIITKRYDDGFTNPVRVSHYHEVETKNSGSENQGVQLGSEKAGSEKTRGRFPWSEWTSGKSFEVYQNEDFDQPVATFQIVLHNTARRYGGFMATRSVMDDEGNKGIRFRFVKTKAEQVEQTRQWKVEEYLEGGPEPE